jgi:hypothetical protein
MKAVSVQLSAISLVITFLGIAPWSTAQELQRVPAIVHVHSNLSTGVHSLDNLVSLARDQKIEAILLTENLLLRVDYGFLLFRLKVVEYPSVFQAGVERYLADVARVQRQHPDVFIVPGVEVIPYYYWTGSLLTGQLTHHDLQKNLLIFGLTDPEALKRLPVIGNPWNGRYEWQSLLLLAPGLLLIPGLRLAIKKTRRPRRMGRFVVVEERRRWPLGGVFILFALFGLAFNYPFTVDPLYGRDLTLMPYQALIDYVRERGGMTVWSLPEARDQSAHQLLGLTAKLETEPYPDDLIRTDRYTAFGALYDQTTSLPNPGERWDYLLGKFLANQRQAPGWAIGEAAYHSAESGKRFGGIQTVFMVTEKNQTAILESFRRGRFYALQKGPASLVLDEWSAAQSSQTAQSGDWLKASGADPIEVRMAVSVSDSSEIPVRVTLIRRGGEIAGIWSGKTPFRATFKDSAPPAKGYYRLDVRGPGPHRIISNPIFVENSSQQSAVSPQPFNNDKKLNADG